MSVLGRARPAGLWGGGWVRLGGGKSLTHSHMHLLTHTPSCSLTHPLARSLTHLLAHTHTLPHTLALPGVCRGLWSQQGPAPGHALPSPTALRSRPAQRPAECVCCPPPPWARGRAFLFTPSPPPTSRAGSPCPIEGGAARGPPTLCLALSKHQGGAWLSGTHPGAGGRGPGHTAALSSLLGRGAPSRPRSPTRKHARSPSVSHEKTRTFGTMPRCHPRGCVAGPAAEDEQPHGHADPASGPGPSGPPGSAAPLTSSERVGLQVDDVSLAVPSRRSPATQRAQVGVGPGTPGLDRACIHAPHPTWAPGSQATLGPWLAATVLRPHGFREAAGVPARQGLGSAQRSSSDSPVFVL